MCDTIPNVKKRIYQRWFAILGIFAMLGALVAMPLTSTYALSMASTVHAEQTSSADDMPCHKPTKPAPCPDCPQKVCPEMGTCLVKCFQQLVPPLAGGTTLRPVVASQLAPEPSVMATGSLVPPLLRPPSV